MSRWAPTALPLVGCLLVLTTGLGHWFAMHDRAGATVVIALGQWVLYAAGVAVLLRRPPVGAGLIAALGCALAARLVLVAAPPVLSTDIYRYVWDGRVQAAGVNPYRYVPADPALAALRDVQVYPNINRRDYATTIYPPVAQFLFYAVTRLDDSVAAMKLAMVACEAGAALLLWRLLQRQGRPAGHLLIYAWHPLPIWSFAGDGHVDAAMILGVVVAFWLCRRERPALSGVALAAACLVKPSALLFAPALYRPWSLRLPAAFLVTAAACYGVYLGAGWRVLGFLPGYVQEEGLESGTAFWPLAVARALLPVPIPTIGFVIIAGLMLAGLTLVLIRQPEVPSARKAVLLSRVTLITASPHFAWYLAAPLALCCLQLDWSLLYMAGASVLLYVPRDFVETGTIVYGGGLAVAVAAWIGRERLAGFARRAAARPAG